jgi:hypothetical protein
MIQRTINRDSEWMHEWICHASHGKGADAKLCVSRSKYTKYKEMSTNNLNTKLLQTEKRIWLENKYTVEYREEKNHFKVWKKLKLINWLLEQFDFWHLILKRSRSIKNNRCAKTNLVSNFWINQLNYLQRAFSSRH